MALIKNFFYIYHIPLIIIVSCTSTVLLTIFWGKIQKFIRSFWWLLLLIIGLTFLSCLLIYLFILSPNISSAQILKRQANNNWVDSTIIGSLIGGLIAFLTAYLTINNDRKIHQESYMPILNIHQCLPVDLKRFIPSVPNLNKTINGCVLRIEKKSYHAFSSTLLINFYDKFNVVFSHFGKNYDNYGSDMENEAFSWILQNLGLGPVIDLRIRVEGLKLDPKENKLIQGLGTNLGIPFIFACDKKEPINYIITFLFKATYKQWYKQVGSYQILKFTASKGLVHNIDLGSPVKLTSEEIDEYELE